MQVKYRLGKLSVKDKTELKKMKINNIDDLEIQAGISILLDEKENAVEILREMNNSLRSVFEDYPIYNLIQDKIG